MAYATALVTPPFAPIFPAPERAVLTLLNAALIVTEQSLHDAHLQLDGCPDLQHNAPIVLAVARLITGRCTELRKLLELYDAAVDDIMHVDDAIPF